MAEEENNEFVIMQLIMAGGNAKGSSVEAIRAAKSGDLELAAKKLEEADKFMVDAHNAQTAMLTKEAQGEHTEVSLLMVHAQDHIMNAITFRDLAGEIVDLYKRLDNK